MISLWLIQVWALVVNTNTNTMSGDDEYSIGIEFVEISTSSVKAT